MRQSDSLVFPCNIPDPPRYKYRHIKSSDSDPFNSFIRVPLNLYRGRYIDDLWPSNSDPCSGYRYRRKDLSDSLYIQDASDATLLRHISLIDSHMPVIQDGNAYRYQASHASRYTSTLYSRITVNEDVDCPVYFAKYIDYAFKCSDSVSYSCSSSDSFQRHTTWYRTCPYEWHMLGYQPASIMDRFQLGAWNVCDAFKWYPTYDNNYDFGTRSRTIKWIVQRPAGTQYICSDSTAEPVFDCIQL